MQTPILQFLLSTTDKSCCRRKGNRLSNYKFHLILHKAIIIEARQTIYETTFIFNLQKYYISHNTSFKTLNGD